MGINLEWRQGLVGHYCINCHILLFICLLVSLCTYVHLSLPKKSMKPLPGIEPEPSTNQVDVLTITPQRYYLLSEGTRHYLLKLKVTYLRTFLKCIDLKNFTFKCKIILSIPFFSQLSDKVFYLHFTLYTLTTPKKCRQINSESQSRKLYCFCQWPHCTLICRAKLSTLTLFKMADMCLQSLYLGREMIVFFKCYGKVTL